MKATEQQQLKQLTEALRAQQRAIADRSLEAFGKLYLPKHVSKPGSSMHAELYPMLERLREERGARIAVAAPRGSAKSTLVDTVFILWAICHKIFKFIVLLSDTADKAGGFLGNVKDELVLNEQLRTDFPEVCEKSRTYPRPPRWKKNEIITSNGVRVLALGAGQNIRGVRHREDRPDLIVLDDVENSESIATAEARSKVERWVHRSILMAGTKETNVIVVGTISHYGSLLAKLTDPVKSPLWTSRVYRSVIKWSSRKELWENWVAILRRREEFGGATGLEAARAFFKANQAAMLEGTQVLWPDMEDYHTLMLIRESDGPAAFDSEKQNEPVNPEDCYFLEEDFKFWDDQWPGAAELIDSLGKNARFFGACDPSLGKHGKNADDSAIITLVRDSKSGNLYVLDADIARRKPDQIIESILAYRRLRKYDRFGFETNQFQAFLAEELKRRSAKESLYLSVHDIHHTSDKLGRIQSLQPLIRSGTLQFSKRHTTLLEQLRLFPKASHDDGPDALEMAVEAARKGRELRLEDWYIVRTRRLWEDADDDDDRPLGWNGHGQPIYAKK